ncbi:MAG: lipoyl synthase [Myxococcales bacterium]
MEESESRFVTLGGARERKPEWLKVRLPGGPGYERVRSILESRSLHTVCSESRCPNVAECWGGGTATVMLMGDVCTRACRFCHVKSGRPAPLDPEEPAHLAEAVAALSLRYLVVTSVDRDDLPDGGAAHFAAAIRALRTACPGTRVEVLIPDFRGDERLLDVVLEAGPDVVAQNLETVRRLTHPVRDAKASYDQTLRVLAHLAKRGAITKSSLMVGLGESREELRESFRDLRAAGVEVLTLGQYLRPSAWHLPVERFVAPAEFDELRAEAEAHGFAYVAAGPLVRSSYRAAEYFLESRLGRGLVAS